MIDENLSDERVSDEGPKRVVGDLVAPADVGRAREWGTDELRGSVLARAPLELFPRVITFLANRRSVGTRREYRRELEEFAEYVAIRFPDLKNVRDFTLDHVVRYRIYVESRGLASATISRKLAALSAYFRFLAGQTETSTDGKKVPLVDRDLFYGLERPRVENAKDTAALTQDQVERILSAVPLDSLSGLLHHAVLSILFGTGRRRAAIQGLRRGDIFEEGGRRVYRVKTKGGKIEKRVLLDWVWASIERYIHALEGAGVVFGPDDFIFQAPPKRTRGGNKGLPINGQAIYAIMRKYCASAGLRSSNGIRFSPHSARATYATVLSQAGVPIEVLQADLGHANIETTRRYVKRAHEIANSPAYKLPYFDSKMKAGE